VLKLYLKQINKGEQRKKKMMMMMVRKVQVVKEKIKRELRVNKM